MDRSAQEDLAVIRQLMEETRREAVDRGKHLTIWGGISTVGLLTTWWAALGRAALDPAVVWAALLVVGWGASLYVGWRDGRGARVRTAGRRLLNATWVAAAVTLTLVAVAGLFGGVVSVGSLAGVLSVVLAIPMLLTARLTGESWLGWVAAGWWFGGGVMLFVPGIYALPLMAGMSLLLLVVPGVVLNGRAVRGGGGAAVVDGA